MSQQSNQADLARTRDGCRRRQRGSVLLVVMVSLVALVSLGTLTVLTVRSGLSGTSHDRFKAVALFAAESGVAVAMDYLRTQHQEGLNWGSVVNPNNNPAFVPPASDLLGNGVKPGLPGNLFDPALGAWYEVEIRNNRDDGPLDPGPPPRFLQFQAGKDTDGRVIVVVTGHGPNNAAARIDIEVTPRAQVVPCETSNADNSGFRRCDNLAGGVQNGRNF
ncbi:hypothetical protein [Haliangium sp.]|uniref:hypothetical protein n=1 Tax=Haliangium sp. TaxID=2663208 RepID=UPI003D116E3E